MKYHVLLHGIFKQAVRDRVIPHNPAADTRLPKVVTKPRRILTPEEFHTLLAHIPERWLPLKPAVNTSEPCCHLPTKRMMGEGHP